MQQINITHLADEDAFLYSHSVAEGGENAASNSWRAALSGPRPILRTYDERDEARDCLQGFGAWSRAEIDAWNNNELDALVLQFIAGDIRESGAGTLEEIDWNEYEEQAERGQNSGRLSRSENEETGETEYYFYIGD